MKTMIIKGVERLMEISTVSTIKRAKTDGAEYHRLLKRTLASQRGVINLNKIMTDSNLCIVMIDRTDLESICANTAFIVDAFNREARHAMTLKKLEI